MPSFASFACDQRTLVKQKAQADACARSGLESRTRTDDADCTDTSRDSARLFVPRHIREIRVIRFIRDSKTKAF
jgi:hypothetical protein